MIASSISTDEAIVTIRILLVTIRSSFRIMPTTPGRTSPPAATCSQERHNRAVGIRAEVSVEPVKVPVVDHCLLFAQPRVPFAGHRIPAPAGPPHPGLLLGHAGEQELLPAVMAGQVLPGHLVLALPLSEMDQVQVAGGDVVVNAGG